MDLIGDYIQRKKGLKKIRTNIRCSRNLRRHLRRHDLPGACHGRGQRLAGYR
jgi:hypothetical protein